MSLEPPEKVRKLRTALHAKAKAAPSYRFYLLYDKLYREDVLAYAYRVCKAHRGAPGVDRQTFADIEAYGEERWLGVLAEELRNRTYCPQAVRRVWIPKADGKQRPLGIPTVRDRVVQTAAVIVLEPIFEADLLAYATGLGLEGQQTICTAETEHFHADLLGSTVLTTNSAGLLEQSFACTAFGEPVAADPADTTRYGYAGSHGYESGLLTLACPDPTLPPITLQHVGHRWYEPAIGRFVQRDPIGIGGGINVYAYVDGNPLTRIDSTGRSPGPPQPPGHLGYSSWDEFYHQLKETGRTRMWNLTRYRNTRNLKYLRQFQLLTRRLSNLMKHAPGGGLLGCVVLGAEVGAAAGRAFDRYLKTLGSPLNQVPRSGEWRKLLR